MITGFVSVGTVLDKLYRDLNINKEINFYNVVSWCNEVLLKVGAYSQFKENKVFIELEDGKGNLPGGFYKIIDLIYNYKPLHWASNTSAINYGAENCGIPNCCTEHSFYIENNCLITDIKGINKKVQITYLSMFVDEEGYPMIPDDVYFQEACAKYVTYMLDYQEWRKGLIPDKVLQKSEIDYLFYINSARGSANLPNVQQLENLKNIIVRMIPQQNQFTNSFRNNSSQEKRIRY